MSNKTCIIGMTIFGIIAGNILAQEEAHDPHDHHEPPSYVNLYHSNDQRNTGYSGAIFKTKSSYITNDNFKDFLKIHWYGYDSWQSIEQGIQDGSVNSLLPIVLKQEDFYLIRYLLMLYPNATIEPINDLDYNKRFVSIK